ncbi:hypothetical protein QLQ12_16025 [Actinoplanes sp. NEAU-A12]|uniref:Lipoprotein n=1 Tax=Actinoplanes sandaracinus TaxID=3045177 RepID=A0ABT6WK95_9ACTN|nr:hypothetical protein [Actinoplanes sandaracinus]MDI6100111.1 hypothetical protein [Actinoplanes sandaracinus]
MHRYTGEKTMKPYRAALLVAATSLLISGCTTPANGSAGGSGSSALRAASRPTASGAPASAPAGPDAREQLMAALEKSKNTTYKFVVSGDVPDKKKVAGSGAFDPKAKRITVDYKVSGGGAKTEQTQQIVVGTDLYSRQKKGETWVHLNLKRVKKDSLYYFDMTDPTGFARFVSTVATVESTGANAFRGTLDIKGDSFNEGFLPVGTPAISVLFGGAATFTATTDAAGWVTTIGVELKDRQETLTMVTKLSEHGKPSGIKKPSNFGEAMDFYYDK